MAKRCHFGFDMPVVFHNRSKIDPALAASLGAKQLDSLDEVLGAADFISLHCPGGGANRHLMNADRFKAMKPSAFLINTARGDIVDEAALVQALKSGELAGAGLDVFEVMPEVICHKIKRQRVCCFDIKRRFFLFLTCLLATQEFSSKFLEV